MPELCAPEYGWPEQLTDTHDTFDTYWSGLAAFVGQSDNPDFLASARYKQRQLKRLSQNLEDYVPESSHYMFTEIEEWWQACGSLNTMRGAEGTLNLASDIYLQDISRAEDASRSQYQFAGELLFQRAILGRGNLGVNESIFQSAVDCYERILCIDDLQSEEVQPLGIHEFKSYMAQYDLRFEHLQQQFHDGEISRRQLRQDYRREFKSFIESSSYVVRDWLIELKEIDMEIDTLRTKSSKKEKKERKNLQRYYAGRLEWVGGMACEVISSAMLRYKAMRERQEDIVSVRSAFIREEHCDFIFPGVKKVKIGDLGGKHGFDIAYTRFDVAYPYGDFEPVQVKVGQQRLDRKNERYLPPITIVDSFRELSRLPDKRAHKRGRHAEDAFGTLDVIEVIDDVLGFVYHEVDEDLEAPNDARGLDRVEALIGHVALR